MKSFVTVCLLIALICSCGCNKAPEGERTSRKSGARNLLDLPQIKERGKLIALTGFSVTSYFIYRGEPMGYEYELLKMLADHLGLEVEIKIVRDMDKILDQLGQGKGDIIAHNMARTKQRAAEYAFTKPNLSVPMVLIQRKPDNWRKMKLHEIEKTLIRNPIKLIDKPIHVRKNSSYHQRLINLSEEIGGDINIKLADGNLSTDELIGMVANGKIDYTVADENIAQINRAYYSNIDIKTKVSMPQQIGWVVRKESPQLLEAINNWLGMMEDSTEFYVIYNKYFKNRSEFRDRIRSDYFSISGCCLSPYDTLIQDHAKRINWDWKLLASQIYQESQFNPRAKSWSGAMGLMQLLPKTARSYGVVNLRDPESNIQAGVDHLLWLDDYWEEEIPDSAERIKFILGSYNVGHNHVRDAQNLAVKYGANPKLWEGNVDDYLLKKSHKKFYNDEVVHYGYCRGIEPVNYVEQIFERYKHYQTLLQEADSSMARMDVF